MIIFKYIALIIYYSLAQYLPHSYTPILGTISKCVITALCKVIFKKCGNNVNIERKAYFGTGKSIQIGNNSGLGSNCHVPDDTIIGDNVMMADNCYILSKNHNYSNISIPMCQQGSVKKQTVIADDVWIGRNVIMTPGRIVAKGTIIAAGTVLTKNFPEYSIVGGNPGKFIKSRKE